MRESPDAPMFVARRFGQINEIVVKADRHRSGVGQLLMKQAHDWLSGQDVNQVQLHVWTFNENAIRFYQALGYTILSQVMSRSLP